MIRALASTLVASSSGTPRKSGSVSANGISVQPRITASAPCSTSFSASASNAARAYGVTGFDWALMPYAVLLMACWTRSRPSSSGNKGTNPAAERAS